MMRCLTPRYLLFLSASFLLATSVRAQSPTGSMGGVVRSELGVGIEGAVVEIPGLGLGTLTDERGRYTLRSVPVGRLSFRVERLGYVAVTREITIVEGQISVADVQLGAAPLRLDPLRVLTKRTRMIGGPLAAHEMTGAAHVLGAADMDSPAFVFDNVHDFLRMIPGVNVQDEDGFGLRPNIGLRGTGVDRSSKITLMEDGVLIAPAPYSAPSAYYFPVAGRMEAIEVRKGASQVKYGPRTIGGAINLVSASIPDGLSWFLEGAGGSHGTRRTHGRLGDSGRHFGWMIEGYSLGTNGFKQLASGGDTGFDIGDYLAKMRVNTDRSAGGYQELELKLGYTDEASSETYLGLTDLDFRSDPLLRYPASGPDLMSAEHRQIQLRHFWTQGRADITTTLYRNDFARNWYKLQSVLGRGISAVLLEPAQNAEALAILRGADSDPDALRVRANNRTYFGRGLQTVFGLDVAGHRLEVGARFHQDEEDRFQWEDGFQMSGGAMVRSSEAEPGSQSNRVSSADAWAFYVQDEFRLGQLTVAPGVRFENIEFTRTDYAKDDPTRRAPTRIRRNGVRAIIPGVGFAYRLSRSLNLFSGVHRGFGPPGPGADDATLPEHSVNYELGGRWQSSGLAAQMTAYTSDYRNILGQATLATGGDGTGEAFNGGSVSVVGIESSLDYDFAWRTGWRIRLPVRVAFTYTRGEFRSDFDSKYEAWGSVVRGDRLPYLPEYQWSGSMGFEHPDWSLTLSAIGSSASRTRAGQGTIPVGQGTDPFVVLNFAGEVDVPGGGTLFVGVQNLTDRRYLVARRPAGLRPGLPRTVLVGFRMVAFR
ncbi:MAG: TonB-dependent receptor [Gemmatimonadetes bacterium]|nr:TonB-dependent receptor [Gemmatimonadota bacterium]